jgi:hypothetical protein
MKNFSNVIKGLRLAGCLLLCLFAALEARAAKDPANFAVRYSAIRNQ